MLAPRRTFTLGLIVAGLGFTLSLVMWAVTQDPLARQPWRLGMIGFGATCALSFAGMLLARSSSRD